MPIGGSHRSIPHRAMEWLAPPCGAAHPDEHRRARLLAAFGIALGLAGVPFAIVYCSLGCVEATTVVFATVACVPVLLLLNRKARRRAILANVFVGILYTGLTLIAFYTGGHRAPAVLWYILIPIVAMSLAGLRSAVVWTAVAIGSATALWMGVEFGIIPIDTLGDAAHQLVGFVALLFAIVITLLLSYLYEFNKNRMLGEISLSEERHRSITHAALDAIIIADAHGRVLFWNPAAQAIFGFTAAETVGRNLMETIVPERHHEAKRRGMDNFAKTGEGPAFGKTLEMTALRKDRSEFPIELSLSRYQGVEGHVAVAFVRDISDRKAAETSLRKAHEELEQRVRERTASLAEATKAAETANRAKSQFLANMSHELRTPLNGVIGMTGALLRTELDAQQKRYVWLAKSSGDMLLSLINDILDFSKIEAGKLELECIDFDLHYTVENVGASLASPAASKELELVCSVHPSVPRLVRGDPGRLQQVLINLVTNAIKFTDRGEVLVRVTLDDENVTDATLRFTVTDTGIGIPPDRTDRLFKSFSQVDASTTRKFGGTGLGLAICRSIVDAMGGRIGVDSAEGRGSTFWFIVTLQKQPQQARPPLHLEDIRCVRILAVDDNETNRAVLQENFASWKLDCDVADSGPAALARLRAAARDGRPYGIAVIDMQMPEMDGAELARLVRDDPLIEQTVLVLLTSMPEGRSTEELARLGFSGWASKPVRPSELMDVLAAALACARSTRPALAPPDELFKPLPKTAGRRGRILLVEDNEISQEVAISILGHAGYTWQTVGNGKEAVDALESDSYDLVLMDCHMPVMDGFEATRAIRRMEEQRMAAGTAKRRIPIVALTANALQGDRERCLATGMDDYIAKPLDANELVRIIEANLHFAATAPQPNHRAPQSGARDDEAQTASPLDFNALVKRWGNDKVFARRLLTKFAEQAPRDVETLRAACRAHDAEQLANHAHRLKGAASYVNAERVRRIAAQLETQARDGELTGACERVAELDAAVQECVNLQADAAPTNAAP